jgi:hypothetical protein
MNRRLIGYGALAVAAVIVLGVAAAAYQSLQAPFQNPTTSSAAPSLSCSPAPCANLQGYTLWVTDLNVAGDLVTMQITFKNSSDSTHAAPEDLRLVDANRHRSDPVFDAPSCTQWSRHEFNHGAMYGPLTVCFRQAGVTSPLVLRWSPDFGFVCCQTDIKLD